MVLCPPQPPPPSGVDLDPFPDLSSGRADPFPDLEAGEDGSAPLPNPGIRTAARLKATTKGPQPNRKRMRLIMTAALTAVLAVALGMAEPYSWSPGRPGGHPRARSAGPDALLPLKNVIIQARARQRRRQRRIILIAAAVGATAGWAAAGSGSPPRRQRRSHPDHGGTPAVAPMAVPGQFSPFIAYAAFGWLPAGYKLLQGGTSRGSTYQIAWRPSSSTAWYLLAYPAGGCQLTQARGLLCKAYYPFGPLALTSRAPAINGHRAYWATAYAADQAGPVLAWQYAPGSWAVLELGKTKPLDAHWRQVAVKAASHVRFGVHAAPPVAFPVQLTGLPASWRLISGVRAWMPEWNGVTYQPYRHLLYASRWSVSTGAASTGPRARPFFTFTIGLAAQRGSCGVPVQRSIVHTVVNGYRVTVSRGPFEQALCAANADGLWVQIDERSNRPGAGLASVDVVGLFARHLHLLGASPAHWATQPIR